MRIIDRYKERKRELEIKQYAEQGYSRWYYENWERRVNRDTKSAKEKGEFSNSMINKIHKKGFLCDTVSKYQITNLDNTDILPDKLYWHFVFGCNHNFQKWIREISFMNRILMDHRDVCPEVYYTVHNRNGKVRVLATEGTERKALVKDIMELAREKGEIVLSADGWKNSHYKKVLRYDADEECFYLGKRKTTTKRVREFLRRKTIPYVARERIATEFTFKDVKLDMTIRVWFANDVKDESPILFAEAGYTTVDHEVPFRGVSVIDIETGEFSFPDGKLTIPNWDVIKNKLETVSDVLKQITYYSLTIALTNDGMFKIVAAATNPSMPSNKPGEKMLGYLKYKYNLKYKAVQMANNESRYETDIANRKYAKKAAAKGFRPYMLQLWENAKKEDLLETEGISLEDKKWAHKKGFLSYRIWQYGLTKDNYKKFLSDRDYYWLNRINNTYQEQINDKTTYRLIMEPFKEYLPKYFFCCLKRNNEMEYIKMPDCPEQISGDFNGLLELLKIKGKLALKASSGTHGDGFYCVAYEDGNLYVNDEPTDEADLCQLIGGLNSVYIVTEFLHMHEELQKIYAKTVNTIRVMVINENGYDPKIMQTYMRIGASKTGYTDNVGYGGICCLVDKDTGEIYQPESIKDHVFYPCPTHPDTGVPIAGFIPGWEEARKVVLDMSKYLGELEYLGYDVAITDEGVKIIEINIHQDLHKVADHTDEIRKYYKKKIKMKKELFKKKN